MFQRAKGNKTLSHYDANFNRIYEELNVLFPIL